MVSASLESAKLWEKAIYLSVVLSDRLV